LSRSATSEGRAPTGIAKFDELIEGGFLRGDNVLVIGNPGTGKTIFSAQFLYHGLEKGEPGIYVSFAESRDAFKRNMARMSMDFDRHERVGKFSFMEMIEVKERAVEELLLSVLEEISKVKARRLVIDSFSALAQAFASRIDARAALHTILGKIPRQYGVTSLVLSESPYRESFGKNAEEFVPDGVVALTHWNERGKLRRRVQIMKMRGTRVNQTSFGYALGNNGIVLYGPLSLEIGGGSFKERVKTGIDGLDRMLSGGVFRGSSTLVTGNAGTGKTTLALHFINEGAKTGEKGLYITFEEPREQLMRQAELFGWALSLWGKGPAKIEALLPDQYAIDELFLKLVELIDSVGPQRIVLDSINPLEKFFSPLDYLEFVTRFIFFCKKIGSTMFLISSSSREQVDEGGSATLVDNIVSLRNVEIESRLKRSLVILKARGQSHDRDIREFEISSTGIAVKDRFIGLVKLLGDGPGRPFYYSAPEQGRGSLGET
jgi:circadian clock protein KaiC